MKNNILKLSVAIIFLAIFNFVFFFTGGTEHKSAVWIAYLMINFTYIIFIVISYCINSAKINYVCQSISAVYFLIQFFFGIIIFIIKPSSYRFSLIIQVILLGIYLIVLLSNIIANDATIKNVEQRNNEIGFINECVKNLNLIKSKVNNQQIIKEISMLIDLMSSSPSKSNSDAKKYESNILILIDKIDMLVENERESNISKYANEVKEEIEKRNTIIKY